MVLSNDNWPYKRVGRISEHCTIFGTIFGLRWDHQRMGHISGMALTAGCTVKASGERIIAAIGLHVEADPFSLRM